MSKQAPHHLNDIELLGLLKVGDERALAAIYDRYWTSLYLMAYNILREKQASEDIVQEIMVQLWTKRERISIQFLPAYLHQSVRYQVFKALRNGKLKESLSFEPETAAYSSADELLIEKDLRKRISEGVEALPEKCRQIFKLSRNEYLSTKEIASRLEIAPKTVENQITIALKRLRSLMAQVLF